MDHEEEREDRNGTEHVVELQEVARPNVAAVVSDEGVPALAPFTGWPYMPHVLLNGSFTDANAQLQQLASDALRAPEHVVLGHRLDERDDLRRESLRLTTGSGLSSPDDLEEVSMPAQQRLGADP